MSNEFTRRRLLQVGAATTTGFAGLVGAGVATRSDLESASPGIGPDSGDEPSVRDGRTTHTGDRDVDAERVPPLDLSDGELQLRAVERYGVPEQATGIRPGSQMFIEFPDGATAGCTANFVWKEPGSSGDLYIGAAGHCFLPDGTAASRNAATAEEKRNGEAFDTSTLDGVSVCADCSVGGLTGLLIEGSVHELGEVVYARQEQRNGEDGVGHDFGLVKIPGDKERFVDRSMPQWGGPNGVAAGALPSGTPIHQYGAGIGNGETYPTMGSSGSSLGGTDDIWYAGIRASPGDSGSPIVGAKPTRKPAGGILTHLTSFGTAGTTIGQCTEMVERDIGLDIGVATP